MRRRTVYKESPSSRAAFKDKYGVEPREHGKEMGPAFSQMTISAILKRRSRKGRISFRKGTHLKGASRRHLGSFVKTERVKALKRGMKKSLLGKEKAPKGSVEPQSSTASKAKVDAGEVKPKKKKVFKLFSRTHKKLQKVPENESLSGASGSASSPPTEEDAEKDEKNATVSNAKRSEPQESIKSGSTGKDDSDNVAAENAAPHREEAGVADPKLEPQISEVILPVGAVGGDGVVGPAAEIEALSDPQNDSAESSIQQEPVEGQDALLDESSTSGDKENTGEEAEAGDASESVAEDSIEVEKQNPGRLNLDRWESKEDREKLRPTMKLQHQGSSSSDRDMAKPTMRLRYDDKEEEEVELQDKTMQLKELAKPESFKGEKPNLDHLDPIDPLVQAFNKQRTLSRKKSAKGMNVMGQWVNMNGKWLRIAMVMEERGQL